METKKCEFPGCFRTIDKNSEYCYCGYHNYYIKSHNLCYSCRCKKLDQDAKLKFCPECFRKQHARKISVVRPTQNNSQCSPIVNQTGVNHSANTTVKSNVSAPEPPKQVKQQVVEKDVFPELVKVETKTVSVTGAWKCLPSVVTDTKIPFTIPVVECIKPVINNTPRVNARTITPEFDDIDDVECNDEDSEEDEPECGEATYYESSDESECEEHFDDDEEFEYGQVNHRVSPLQTMAKRFAK